jgi:glycolate oxidase FAD binding subunit
VVLGLDDPAAMRAMAAAMGSPCEVSGAAHLPAGVAGSIPLGQAVAAGRALTLLRLEGVAPSVAHRKALLLAAM